MAALYRVSTNVLVLFQLTFFDAQLLCNETILSNKIAWLQDYIVCKWELRLQSKFCNLSHTMHSKLNIFLHHVVLARMGGKTNVSIALFWKLTPELFC